MALLTAKVHGKRELEREIESLAEENGKKVELNEDEVQKIKNESKVLVPLKKIVPSSFRDCNYYINST